MDTSFADLLAAAAPQAEPTPEATARARAAALAACRAEIRPYGQWRVERRVGGRRSIVAVAAALVAAVILATPALSVGERLLDLIQGSPSPPEVQTHFAANDRMRTEMFAAAAAAGATMHGRFSPVIAAEARGVFAIETADGPVYLWAAPTNDGRQCWLIQTGADASTARPYGLGGCDDEASAAGMRPHSFWTAERPSVDIVHVRIHDETITSVVLEAANAPAQTLRVASGHALGTVPKEALGLTLIGRNGEGVEVTRATVR